MCPIHSTNSRNRVFGVKQIQRSINLESGIQQFSSGFTSRIVDGMCSCSTWLGALEFYMIHI